MDKTVNTAILEALEPRLLLSAGLFESKVGGDFGDSISTATLIELDPDAKNDVTGSIDTYYDYDYFKFVAPVSGGLHADMLADGGSLDSYLVAYNSYGGYLAGNNNVTWETKDARVSFVVEAGQTYYLLALGIGGTDGGYNLSLEVFPDEHGDSLSDAAEVELETEVTTVVAGGINYVYDYDYIRFVSPITGGLRVTMEGQDAGLDPYLVAYNQYGGWLAANNNATLDTADAEVTFYVEAGATYYILGFGVGATEGDYDLSFSLSPDDYGSTLSEADSVDLSAEGTTVIAGGIDYYYDYDYVKFVAPVSGGLRVDMQADGGSLDSYLVAYNSYGGYLAANNNVTWETKDAQVSFVVEAGETYYIWASVASARLLPYSSGEKTNDRL